MAQNKPAKLKINLLNWIRYLNIATILIIITVLAYLMWFLYQNVYQTLSYAEIVTALKQQVPAEEVERQRFETIMQNMTIKKTADEADIDQLKDPFNKISSDTINP